jgi:hypothetical protein
MVTVASFQIPQLGICSGSRRDDGVVVRSLTGEGLVRVVRLMLAHGRVVVTMRLGDLILA